MDFSSALALLRQGIDKGVIPGAGVAIGVGHRTLLTEALGYAQVKPKKRPATLNTRYDMASLTKVLATSMVALRLAEQGRLSLFDNLGTYIQCPADKADITLAELMTHSSGLPAHAPLWLECDRPEGGLARILSLPLHAAPGTQVEYSCMGYITLQAVIERVAGKSLDVLARELVFAPLGMPETGFCPADDDVAATESDGAGGWWRATVHDENARFLGGVSGNAGLFSTVEDCARFAKMLACHGEGLLSPATFARATANYTPGMAESRGLGFSLFDGRVLSCGEFFSPGTYGHTGFTGTSLWVDKVTGLWVVLLTNAVHFGRERPGFFSLRRRFHNAVMATYSRGG